MKVEVTQLCLTLCDPMDCKVHGILQLRILEWVAFPFSRVSSQPRDRTQVSHIAGGNHKGSPRILEWVPIPSPVDLLDPGIKPGFSTLPVDSSSTQLLGNLYTEYIMQNVGLDEAQAGIKIAGRNISNLRYAVDTTLTAESKEELKRLLMKVVESEKAG